MPKWLRTVFSLRVACSLRVSSPENDSGDSDRADRKPIHANPGAAIQMGAENGVVDQGQHAKDPNPKRAIFFVRYKG